MAWITVSYKTREIASFVPVKRPMSSFPRNTYFAADTFSFLFSFLYIKSEFFFIYIIFPRNIEFQWSLLSDFDAPWMLLQLREEILYIALQLEINQSFKIIERYFILDRVISDILFLGFHVERQLYIYLRCFQLEKQDKVHNYAINSSFVCIVLN